MAGCDFRLVWELLLVRLGLQERHGCRGRHDEACDMQRPPIVMSAWTWAGSGQTR